MRVWGGLRACEGWFGVERLSVFVFFKPLVSAINARQLDEHTTN